MDKGWLGQKASAIPVSVYKDGTDGNSWDVENFKTYTEVKL